MRPCSLSIILIALLLGNAAFAQNATGKNTLVERARENAAKKHAAREARLLKHLDRYHPETRTALMDHYEQQGSWAAQHEYQKSLRKERNRPHEENKVDLRLGYGIGSLTTLAGIIVSSPHQVLSTPTPLGAALADIKYFADDRFSIGLVVGCEFLKGTLANDYSSSAKFRGSYKQTIFTIAPEGTFIIISRKNVLFYTSMALGYSVVNKDFHYSYYDTTYFKNANSLSSGEHSEHINAHGAVGVRFGGTIGGFVEMGLGFKGICNLGLSVKL